MDHPMTNMHPSNLSLCVRLVRERYTTLILNIMTVQPYRKYLKYSGSHRDVGVRCVSSKDASMGQIKGIMDSHIRSLPSCHYIPVSRRTDIV